MRLNKVKLTTHKGYILVACYVLIITAYIIIKVVYGVSCGMNNDDDNADNGI